MQHDRQEQSPSSRAHASDPAGARRLLENPNEQDARKPAFWISLATTFRRHGLPDEETKALERALALEPRNLIALLQKGSLLESQGRTRAAAMVYGSALQSIPRGAKLPAALRAPIERAMQAVRASRAALAEHLDDSLREARALHGGADQSRFDHCVDALLGRRRIYSPQPTFLHFPRLPALEFYPRHEFPWLAELEAATPHIRAEIERVLVESADQLRPYIAYPQGLPLDQWAELNHSRRWRAFYLWEEGRAITDHMERCPATAALLARIPCVDLPGHAPTAFFSVLDAKTHIPPHTGVTNTRAIVHLPLVVPDGCRFRVGSETRAWRPGTAWVFDDTIEHEAWNDSDVPRAILIFDVWNPYLSAAERDLVGAAVRAVAEFNGGQSPFATAI